MRIKNQISTLFAAAALASTLLLFTAVPAFAQDVITVGTVDASGTSVTVPVYIADVAATPLGVDQAAGSRIQSFSIKVDYSPTAPVQSVAFTRAGLTAALTPTFEMTPTAPGSVSWLVSFQESTNPIAFTLNSAAPGDLVGNLVFTLTSPLAVGTTIDLTLDASLTQLTDEGGTGETKETVANENLILVDGAINIVAAEEVPTMSEWMLLLLGVSLALVAGRLIR